MKHGKKRHLVIAAILIPLCLCLCLAVGFLCLYKQQPFKTLEPSDVITVTIGPDITTTQGRIMEKDWIPQLVDILRRVEIPLLSTNNIPDAVGGSPYMFTILLSNGQPYHVAAHLSLLMLNGKAYPLEESVLNDLYRLSTNESLAYQGYEPNYPS